MSHDFDHVGLSAVTDAYAYSIASPNHIALPTLQSPLCVSVLVLPEYPSPNAIHLMLLSFTFRMRTMVPLLETKISHKGSDNLEVSEDVGKARLIFSTDRNQTAFLLPVPIEDDV